MIPNFLVELLNLVYKIPDIVFTDTFFYSVSIILGSGFLFKLLFRLLA